MKKIMHFIFFVLLAWFLISWVDVICCNIPGCTDVVGAWNMFEIIFNR